MSKNTKGRGRKSTTVKGNKAATPPLAGAWQQQFYQEFMELNNYLHQARSDIAAMRSDTIKGRHIATATDELDAVVEASEQATQIILHAAEQIEAAAQQAGREVESLVVPSVTKIYEACNFQDITGQRINKVVKTLKHIEQELESLMGLFQNGAPTHVPLTAVAPSKGDLLNGPQLPSTATGQDEIDKILAGQR